MESKIAVGHIHAHRTYALCGERSGAAEGAGAGDVEYARDRHRARAAQRTAGQGELASDPRNAVKVQGSAASKYQVTVASEGIHGNRTAGKGHRLACRQADIHVVRRDRHSSNVPVGGEIPVRSCNTDPRDGRNRCGGRDITSREQLCIEAVVGGFNRTDLPFYQ